MELHRLCLILLLAIGSHGTLHDYVDGKFFSGKKWIVLVAGSEGWENYRHQADVAHAYQVVRRNGIPEENIIVMMANDVVNHENNPAPGTLINQPNGTDVYKGIKVDYAGRHNVTKNNFLSVLKGHRGTMSRIGSGRVVESESGVYGTCLGDLFSITWLENWDKMFVKATTAAATRTVFKDFQETQINVTMSDVMMYGDFRLGYKKISSFLGYSYGKSAANKSKNLLNSLKINSVVRQQDITEYTLNRQLLNTKDPIKRKSLKEEINHKKNMKRFIDKTMNKIYEKVIKKMPRLAAKIGTLESPAHLPLNMDMFPCYRSIVNRINEKCFSVPKNLPVKINVFANMCVVNEKAHHLVIKFIDVTCSTLNAFKTVMKIK